MKTNLYNFKKVQVKKGFNRGDNMTTLLTIFLLICASNLLFPQSFTIEWQFETLNRAIYVGDIDGDGVGEFVDNSFQENVKFLDAQTHATKYTVNNTELSIIEETSINLVSYNNRFPNIDYNNNGVSDFIFVDYFNPTNPVYRIIDPSTSAVIFEFPDNGTYQFGWLGDFDNDGILELSVSYYGGSGSTQNIIYSTGVTTSSVPNEEHYKPKNFHLYQNFPNPFNPTTTIKYSVYESGNVQLRIYNELGELVRTLINEWKPAGDYFVQWDGKDEKGNTLPSGRYFYELQSENFRSVKKIVFIK